MQIKVTTDYAIRIVLYTAIVGEVVTSRVLSEKLGIPLSLVHKLGKTLGDNGIVEVTTGARGGIRLICPTKDISLFRIINIFEPTTKLNRCLEEDRYCSRFATESCPVRNAYCYMQQQLEDNMKAVTIESLIANSQ